MVQLVDVAEQDFNYLKVCCIHFFFVCLQAPDWSDKTSEQPIARQRRDRWGWRAEKISRKRNLVSREETEKRMPGTARDQPASQPARRRRNRKSRAYKMKER